MMTRKFQWLSEAPSALPDGCKRVAEFPLYCVHSNGTVFSCRGQGGLFHDWTPMIPGLIGHGKTKRRAVILLRNDHCSKTCHVHRIVLETFVGPAPDGMEGCHNDGNPEHNDVSNLRWDTHAANMKDRDLQGNGPSGSRNASAKLNESQVKRIRELYSGGMQQKEIAPIFGVSKQCIQTVCSRKNWGHI